MTNFKQETLGIIGDHEVSEYCFKNIRSWEVIEGCTYRGKDKIDWQAIPEQELNYDKGYGLWCWQGFITFKDTPDWLEREEYDGTEWWVWRSKPSLEKEREKETTR